MAMINPIHLLADLYRDIAIDKSLDSRKSEIARTILWNAMYHLDFIYSPNYRVPNFNQEWAINKSNINLEES